MTREKYTRRNFIGRSVKLMAAAALFPFIITKNKKADAKSPKSEEPLNVTINLEDEKYADLKKTGSSVYVQVEGESRPVIVHRISEGEIAAYSSKCTHQGCKVNLPKNDSVRCPCHGSVFDAKGKLVSGPAREDLKKFSAELSGSTITITAS